MKKGLPTLMLAVSLMIWLVVSCTMQIGNGKQKEETVHESSVTLIEFEIIRDSLYDCAMNICMGLAECDGGCFYTDVDDVYVEIFKTYRVPSLEVLLTILDQVDASTCLWDVYDDDEGTLDLYYDYRERYESFF